MENGLCWSRDPPALGSLSDPVAPAGVRVLPWAAATYRKLHGCQARGLDLCRKWDGLCGRVGLVARTGGRAKLGFGLEAAGEWAGRGSGDDKGAHSLVQPQPALPSARER